MFCTKCGTKNLDVAKFCVKCGTAISSPMKNNTPVSQNENNATNAQQYNGGAQQAQTYYAGAQQVYSKPMEVPEDNNKVSGGLKALLVVALILIVLAIGAGGFYGLSKYNRAKDYQAYAETVNEWKKEIQIEDYNLDKAGEKEYKKLIKELDSMLESQEDKEKIEAQKEVIMDFLKEAENTGEVEEPVKDSGSTSAEATTTDTSDDATSATTSGTENAGGTTATDAVATDSGAEKVKKTVINVGVRQYDFSEYPKMKMYLDVTDQQGNFVDGLSKDAFYVNEGRSIEGPFSRIKLTTAAKLNQNEGLSIGLVADVSGSMDVYMEDAKDAMNTFVQSVQFSKGDQIEVVEFSSDEYICQYFTNDANLIYAAISNMQPNGRTRLYDTLISEVARIGAEGNAKCVIGFTDGYDNESQNSAQNVVDIANTNNVPVFLIGIGDQCDSSTLTYIAESTGGVYRNIDGVADLYDIYASIYKQQKDVYLLEYDITDSDDIEKPFCSEIYVETEDMEGCSGTINIESEKFFEDLYIRFLVAGIDCQNKGERNLLDSGLIIATTEAFKNKEYIAYQCQASIDGGGIGSNNSSVFEALVGHSVLRVYKEGDEYVLYGKSTYDVKREKTYSKANEAEKEMVKRTYGNVSKDARFWFEDRITDYEKLHIVKDRDGKWKFSTRVYEREGYDKAVEVEEVYQAVRMY